MSTLFSSWASGPAWDISEVGAGGDPSVAALTSDQDALNVVVRPGAHVGAAATVAVDPTHPELAPPAAYRLVDDAATGTARSANTLFVRCLPDTDTIIVSGSAPVGGPPLADQWRSATRRSSRPRSSPTTSRATASRSPPPQAPERSRRAPGSSTPTPCRSR